MFPIQLLVMFKLALAINLLLMQGSYTSAAAEFHDFSMTYIREFHEYITTSYSDRQVHVKQTDTIANKPTQFCP